MESFIIVRNKSNFVLTLTDGEKTHSVAGSSDFILNCDNNERPGLLLDGKFSLYFDQKIIFNGAILVTPPCIFTVENALNKQLLKIPEWWTLENFDLILSFNNSQASNYSKFAYFSPTWCVGRPGYDFYDLESTPLANLVQPARSSLTDHLSYLTIYLNAHPWLTSQKKQIFLDILNACVRAYNELFLLNDKFIKVIILRFYFIISEYILRGENTTNEYKLLYELFSKKSYKSDAPVSDSELILNFLLLLSPSGQYDALAFYKALRVLLNESIFTVDLLSHLETAKDLFINAYPAFTWKRWEELDTALIDRNNSLNLFAKLGGKLFFTKTAYNFMATTKIATLTTDIYPEDYRGIPPIVAEYIFDKGIVDGTIIKNNIAFVVKSLAHLCLASDDNYVDLFTPYYNPAKNKIFTDKADGAEVVDQALAFLFLIEMHLPVSINQYCTTFLKRVAKQESNLGLIHSVDEDQGIWQIDPGTFNDTKKHSNALQPMHEAIHTQLAELNIEPNKWDNSFERKYIQKPAYASIGAKLVALLKTAPSKKNPIVTTIPSNTFLLAQAGFWKIKYNTVRIMLILWPTEPLAEDAQALDNYLKGLNAEWHYSYQIVQTAPGQSPSAFFATKKLAGQIKIQKLNFSAGHTLAELLGILYPEINNQHYFNMKKLSFIQEQQVTKMTGHEFPSSYTQFVNNNNKDSMISPTF